MLISTSKLQRLSVKHHRMLSHVFHFTQKPANNDSLDHIAILMKQSTWEQNIHLKSLASYLSPESACKVISLHSENIELSVRFFKWDFKMFYDIKFGRKKESMPKDAAANNQQPTSQASCNGNSSNGTSNGNGHPKNSAELSIYEQYRQERENSTANGVTLNDAEKPKKSLLPAFESAEMRTLAESLSRDIIRSSPNVKWDSIKGLENEKRLLKEAVVMPIKYPKYFTSIPMGHRLYFSLSDLPTPLLPLISRYSSKDDEICSGEGSLF